MLSTDASIHGAGLGLRRSLLGPLADQPAEQIGFMEVAPENWIGIGGLLGKQFRSFTERYPFVLHGLLNSRNYIPFTLNPQSGNAIRLGQLNKIGAT